MTFQKGIKVPITKNFDSSMFDCRCALATCTETIVDDKLPLALEDLWIFTGPFTITSGYRCYEHNLDVGGKADSRHLRGQAADIVSNEGLDGPHMAKYANMVAAFANGGLGVDESFLHCDVRGYRARWIYKDGVAI